VNRIATAAALILCVLSVLPARAGPTRLLDGTTADRWTLPNGLEVVTRDIPGAQAISVTWGFRIGLDGDPADRPGLALLLSEVSFTAPAGDTPARTRDEMESLRPQGWSLRVTRRHTLFTETATPAQLAGVLRQIATRMRGVTVTDEVLRGALATVRRSLGEKYFGAPEPMLQWQLREYATGADAARIVALASGQGLEKETPASVQQALARAYTAGNGVLALAGDLSSLDLRSILTAEFGGLPTGARLPDPPAARFDSVTVLLERPEVRQPMAALGLWAPALTDTLHPAFFMAMLAVGAYGKQAWGGGARFQYALLDDPRFVRFYPSLFPGTASLPAGAAKSFEIVINELLEAVVQRDVFDTYRLNVLWMMGGPMPPTLARSVISDPAALNVLCGSIAAQALWGSDAFWTDYRRRTDFSRAKSLGYFASRITDPRNQAVLVLVPRR
jgi:hypothetical protein